MVQERLITPEKQLLKLIEDPKADGMAAKAEKVKRKGLTFFSPGAWLGRILFFKKGAGRWLKPGSPRQFNIRNINKLLGLCNFMLIVYFVTNLSNSITELGKSPELRLNIKEEKNQDIAPASSLLKAESFYLEKVRQRNIFSLEKPKEGVKKPASEFTPTTSVVVEMTQHLKLVGISWSANPDAMIEDTRALRTFFIKRGELIGEVKVEAIKKDSVVLSYKGEEIELR